jgi:hypothetical protein
MESPFGAFMGWISGSIDVGIEAGAPQEGTLFWVDHATPFDPRLDRNGRSPDS